MKRFLILMLCLAMLVPVLCGCGKQEKEEPTKMLSFSQAQSVEEMQTYDGQKVTIIGYMSTLSPISGDFMYLMNLPYQSCPFCVPNTTQLSNTMAVYAKDGQEFEFTDSAIQVTGVMEFGDYTDEFGYEYGYRIKDAEFSEVDTSDMSEKLKLWQQLASTDVISDVYSMYEYLNFLCYWPSYTAVFGDGEDYLYPTDALHFIQDDGAQYNYGYVEGYFDGIISEIKSVNETAFDDLVANIENAKIFAANALSELEAGNYTQVDEYGGSFGDGRRQYKMNYSDDLEAEMETLYRAFSEWLSGWEL